MCWSCARLAGTVSPWLRKTAFMLANLVAMFVSWLLARRNTLSFSFLASTLCSQARAEVSSNVWTCVLRVSIAASALANASKVVERSLGLVVVQANACGLLSPWFRGQTRVDVVQGLENLMLGLPLLSPIGPLGRGGLGSNCLVC